MNKILIFVLLLSTSFLFSQSKEITDRYWVSFGSESGIAFSKIEFMVADFYFGANYASKKTKYQFRYSHLIDFLGSWGSDQKFNEFGFLYGRGIVKRGYHFMISGGLSLFQNLNIIDENYKYVSFSIPLEAELLLKATKYGGFAFVLLLNLGNERQIISVGGRFAFGKVK